MDNQIIQHVLNSFETIPLEEIQKLLTVNNIPLTSDPYQTAKELLLTNNLPTVPSIYFIDFIIALHSASKQITPINLSDIILSSNDGLVSLAQSLMLTGVDKDRIIRILKFMGLLVDDSTLFERIPEDLLLQIMRNTKCISVICNVSPIFKQLCNKPEALLIMREKVREQIGLITTQYNFEQLKGLCKFGSSKNISIGGNHTLFLTRDGLVYGMGSNQHGRLGQNPETFRTISTPTLINGLNNIVAISAGNGHSLALTIDGQVYAFGNGKYGQLGLTSNTNRYIPTLIPGLSNIISIAAGEYYSLVLDSAGKVYSFGVGQNGQLGLGNINPSLGNAHAPVQIPDIDNIIAIAAGTQHSLLLNNHGQVYTFGSNDAVRLGMGRRETYIQRSPILIPNINNIVAIAVGDMHSLLLTGNGEVYSFGRNELGQLGISNTPFALSPTLIPGLNDIVAIAAGDDHSMALSSTGQVYVFGGNDSGQLGFGDNRVKSVPTLIPNINNIVAIDAGLQNSLLLDNQGQLYAIGNNYFGIFGSGLGETITIPTVIHNIRI